MRRDPEEMSGWQVVDATPQELSTHSGVYQVGYSQTLLLPTLFFSFTKLFLAPHLSTISEIERRATSTLIL